MQIGEFAGDRCVTGTYVSEMLLKKKVSKDGAVL